MLRRLGLFAGWVGATAVVVALGWAAVGTVAGTVTEPPPLAAAPDPRPDAPDPDGAQTFDLTGGSVGVRGSDDAAELLFATPRAGFSVEVRSRGPARVDVRFVSDSHESRFRYEPAGGGQVEERPR